MAGIETTAPQPAPPEPSRRPWQEEMPFAVVDGEPVIELPRDLYIPPDALEVFLEAFEGPLDLLLYLVKRQNLDILDIPVATITKQYMEYIDLMKELRLELAAEYLAMAAMLAEIKSRLLLPQPESIDDEDDPRAELVRRLQEYERYKQAAEQLDELPRVGRDLVEVRTAAPMFVSSVRSRESSSRIFSWRSPTCSPAHRRTATTRCEWSRCRCANACRSCSSTCNGPASWSSPPCSLRRKAARGWSSPCSPCSSCFGNR